MNAQLSEVPQSGDGARDAHLLAGVARLTRGLRDALCELGFDGRLVRIAGDDIPDACSRLDRVVRQGEEAVHRTLDLVEDGRRIADELATARGQLQQGPAGADLSVRLATALAAMAATEAGLRRNLTAMATAQEYQDLSGQVIRRVISLVREVENALLELLRAGGLQSAQVVPLQEAREGTTSAIGVPNAANQDDADRLLASLGF